MKCFELKIIQNNEIFTSRRFSGNKAKRVAEDSKPEETNLIERKRVAWRRTMKQFQRRILDIPRAEAPLGPSPRNSCPKPFPHCEQLTFFSFRWQCNEAIKMFRMVSLMSFLGDKKTFRAPGFSSLFDTLSGLGLLPSETKEKFKLSRSNKSNFHHSKIGQTSEGSNL